MIEPRPTSPADAVQRAQRLLASPGNKSTGYYLGTGTYHPYVVGGNLIDVPWTQTTDETGLVHIGSDCAGFVCWALKLPRSRPGYNRGNPCGIDGLDVEDDLNSNSMLADSLGEQDLFRRVAAPDVGDVLAYPTIHLPGHPLPWIGHVALVVGVDRAGSWDPNAPQYHLLDIIQVCGGNGRMPAAIATDGSVFDKHSRDWPKPEHRSWMLRAVP